MELIKLMVGATLLMLMLGITLIAFGAVSAAKCVICATATGWVAAVVALTVTRRI